MRMVWSDIVICKIRLSVRCYTSLYQGSVSGMLIRNLTAEHVYLACGRTDMRKSIDGLAALVLSKFQLDPHQPALFLF